MTVPAGTLLRLPYRGDVHCPTCHTVFALADVQRRAATALCRFCDLPYPCFNNDLHRVDLGDGHKISPVCVSAFPNGGLIYGANCLCGEMVSSTSCDRARRWVDDHTVEVAAELATA